MYLKSLKITGFKSFADRTRIDLEPGVTVIVGPNGSGKSNVVDSVAWVMGTQSTKNLRTEKMEDVIFAGTAMRPSLGRAEVTLTFDNASGLLPLDMPEVSVTRRLYRDGSSDYEINGVSCRLLDVQELLADSGVGRHQHVIVGQGQLDAVLNAKPDDHRAIIEEAAGVLKHRQRKDRSIRRLERTDADVLRLMDILKELKRQIRPLKRQAQDADRREGLRADVRAFRLFLGGEDLRRITNRIGEAAAQDVSLAESGRLTEREFDQIEGSLDALADAAGEAGRALDRDTTAAARLETTAERLRSITTLAAERARSLAARLEGAGERRGDLAAEAEELTINLALSIEDQAASSEAADRSARILATLEDEERSLAEQESMPAEGAIAIVRGDLRSAQSANDRDRRERDQISKRLDGLVAQVDRETAEIDRANADILTLDVEQGVAQAAHDAARRTRADETERLESIEADFKRAELTLASAAARADALAGAVAGLADPAARLRAESADAVVGPICAALDIPADLAAAIDAALGPWADALTVSGPSELGTLVGDLKSEGLGGVPMVTALAGASTQAREVAASWGLQALIDGLGPKADRPLAETLIGDVILAEGWSSGWEVVQRHPNVRVVTPEGDLISAYGVRIAHPDGATPAMLEAALVALELAEQEGARAKSRFLTAKREHEQARTAEHQARTTLEQCEARLAGTAEALARLMRSRDGLSEEITRLEARRTALAESASEREEHVARLEERLAALEGEEAERQKAWEALAQRRREVADRRDSAKVGAQEAAATLGAVIERRAMLERRLEEVSHESTELRANPVDPADIAHLEKVEAQARQALDIVRDHIRALRTRQVRLRQDAGEAGRRLREARNRRDELQRNLAATKDRLAKLGIELAELRVRHEATAEGLRRDADASEDMALAARRPDVDENVDLPARLIQLDNELRRMGPINPLAAAEYRELNERYEFMQAQLDDLEHARNELRSVIKAVDERIETLFTEAFHQVAEFYEEHFSILFPGGQGKLVLTDPQDALGSGVDIKAQPLGKKVSRLQLLSGGERSLAALAFLFAVFKARPSPFYIMDEVEAALDDANLHRFLDLVDNFREAAQLVIVTHQQQTMECADVLYGVTMEPGGSSKVIAKKMTGQLAFEDA